MGRQVTEEQTKRFEKTLNDLIKKELGKPVTVFFAVEVELEENNRCIIQGWSGESYEVNALIFNSTMTRIKELFTGANKAKLAKMHENKNESTSETST